MLIAQNSKPEPPLPWSGGCLCKRVRYEVRVEPLTLTLCHCTICQKRTGSAFSIAMAVVREGFVLTAGPRSRATCPAQVARCYRNISVKRVWSARTLSHTRTERSCTCDLERSTTHPGFDPPHRSGRDQECRGPALKAFFRSKPVRPIRTCSCKRIGTALCSAAHAQPTKHSTRTH